MFGIVSVDSRTQAVHSACCLQPSFRKLTVRLLTFSAPLRWSWLQPPALFDVELWASLSATSFAACLNCGFSRCNRSGFFSGLVLLNCLLFFMRILDSLYLVFSIRQLSVSEKPRTDVIHSGSVSALAWFSHSSYPSPSTPRLSWTCTCTRRGPLNLEVCIEVLLSV